MVSIIFDAIKWAPRIFWYSYAQPSNAVDFFSKRKRNISIFRWSCFFSGSVLGSVLAIPHYFFYHNLMQSILFAFALALAVTLSGTLLVTFASALAITSILEGTIIKTLSVSRTFKFLVGGALAGLAALVCIKADNKTIVVGVVAIAFAGAGTFAGAVAGAFAGAVASAFAGAVTAAGAFLCILLVISIAINALGLPVSPAIVFLFTAVLFILYLYYSDKIELKGNQEEWFFFPVFILIFLGLGGLQWIKLYEILISPLAFLIGYLFNSSLYFSKKKREFKENLKSKKIYYDDIIHRKFGKTQKASLLWGPLITFLLYLPAYSYRDHEFIEKIHIAGICFSVMPLLILHIPDYFLCLPIWLYQQRKILKKYGIGKEILKAYEKSLVYKHEMLYFQLPGLHSIMVSLARNNEIGIKETVKRIDYLYRFTFQQKQAKKAITFLGQNKETSHQCIHFLLEEKNLSLLETLAKNNRVADLYLELFKKINILQDAFTSNLSIKNNLLKNFIPELRPLKKLQYVKETLPELVDLVCREMEKEEGYRFNPEMANTLRFFQKLLTLGGLKDFYNAMDSMDNSDRFPLEIDYFTNFGHMVAQLQKIKADLLKIEFINRFETKRSFLSHHKDSFEALAKAAKINFYEPFRTLWQKALANCAWLVERELTLLQGSAALVIYLKNREITISAEERNLYFTIHNKGRELAANLIISLQDGIPLIAFCRGNQLKINIIEADAAKQIAFPIIAPAPGKTTVRGTITFSDQTREDKKLDFSFPITLVKMHAEFREIKNPYIVGQPLTVDTPLYFGRDDAYEFIDKNIMASGAHHTIVCHGLRRTGKTSLLYRIESKGFTDRRLTPINVDLQGIENEKDFYATLSDKISDKLSLKLRISATTVKSFGQFKEFLKEIKPELGERIIILMMDEFEELQLLVDAGRISRAIFSNIRHLMQHEEKLIFLFCGTHRLEEMSADYWSIFFNTAMYLKISRLKTKDAIRLIKEPVKDQLNFDDLAVEQILKMTGGQPYLTQLICRTVVNDLNENKKRNDVVIDDVDEAVKEIVDGGTEHFSQHIWDMSNSLEHLLLSAAAGEMTHKQLDYIDLEAIFKLVQGVTTNFTRKQILVSLEKLVSRDILMEKDMCYFFPMNLVRKWVTARYPLIKVREEI